MVLSFISNLSTGSSIFLVICVLCVCLFEAINGFHDTANAVATVIYTNTLKPVVAVVWSGFFNFLGVYWGGIAVAMGIVKLIPLNDLMVQPLGENISLVLAILLAAIIWNFGTWYFGIPSSSSHALIGSLLGAGMAFYLAHHGENVNWGKAKEIGLSLLISPLFGFTLAVALMFVLRILVGQRRSSPPTLDTEAVSPKGIFDEPDAKNPPPLWIRAILVTTCTLVSFFHGSNDGQKGVGLLLVVLMAFLPMQYAFNHDHPMENYRQAVANIGQTLSTVGHPEVLDKISTQAREVGVMMDQLDKTNKDQLFKLRKSLQSLNKNLDLELNKTIDGDPKNHVIPAAAAASLRHEIKALKHAYEFVPTWAIMLISICLGIGTMVGWKRIVVTIGEKIGKTHLTYAQGASAEICAAATIGVSTGLGLPVSTTHVLSSGIAGSMVASGGLANLQRKTVSNIALAWLLTLPATFSMAFGLFWLFRMML